MSQVTASSRPPPIAWPLTAAITGYGNASIASIASTKGCATSFSPASAKVCSSLKLPMWYPAENTGPSPVMRRQRASVAPRTASPSVSRISWSSAPRLSGFEIRSRSTRGAGSSESSLPEARSTAAAPLLEDDKRVALRDRLTLLTEDLIDRAVVLGLDRHLHLHRLEDHDRVALLDLLAQLDLDLPDRPGDVRLDVRQLLDLLL